MKRLILAALVMAMASTGYSGYSGYMITTLEMVQPVNRSGQNGVSLYPNPGDHPDCESIGYVHAWDYPRVFGRTAMYCPDDPGCNDPPETRVCRNCGKSQVKPKPTQHPWEDVK